VYKLVPWGA